ncbi:hypothetical protein AB0C96_37755 [Streptomyces sp. NPDC048506]|uniref:hypothetical protein n=1 Tax=Streptomyces sp. NPDC048506 TaxID=3155028 RepID=UPI003431E810
MRVLTVAAVLATTTGYGIDCSTPAVTSAGHRDSLSPGAVLADSAWGRTTMSQPGSL